MTTNETEGLDGGDQAAASACPYCSSTERCPHLLLLVDKTFCHADGGPLMEWFNTRWDCLCEDVADGADFDESEALNVLLSEIEACADDATEYEHEGSPGGSSNYVIFFGESADKVREITKRLAGEGAM